MKINFAFSDLTFERHATPPTADSIIKGISGQPPSAIEVPYTELDLTGWKKIKKILLLIKL